MSKQKYLSKSLFKSALECRTRLFYAMNSSIYKNNNIEDPFLKSIAEGGFQVGELAKCYYPKGIEIDSKLSFEENFEETKKLLQKKNVVIFEGVLIFDGYLARFDILEKNNDTIRLIEVKSKSYNGGDFNEFLNKKNGSIKSDWVDNMYDITYQKWILSKVYPKYKIETYLMLADKSCHATVNNLNQKFILSKDEKGNTKVIINGDTTKRGLGENILSEVNIDEIINIIENHVYTEGRTFEEWLELLMDSFKNNTKLTTKLGKKCSDCPFTCTPDEERLGWKDGKKECWVNSELVGSENMDKPTVLDIWNYRSKDKKISEGVMLMENIKPSEFMKEFSTYTEVEKFFDVLNREMSEKERQVLQLWKTNTNDNSLYINKEKLKEEMDSWKYPYHMIDFETTSVAIPMHKGMKPYEGIAFQFSHHIMYEDGRIEHAGEYINKKVGKFPNFEFVRELKKQLEKDNGTIFRYSPHENSYLNTILIQMLNTEKSLLPDRDELVEFIKTITHKSSSTGFDTLDIEDWKGERDMVDLWDILKKYYYNPYTNGSNSIKDVLPSILKVSNYLKNKYSEPIYGTDKIKSTNFKGYTWLKFDTEGNIIDPYKQLPYAFEGIDSSIVDTFINSERIADGGAAMTAYAKIQFTDMSELERERVISSLLKYCELDTFAMVMLCEHWQEIIYGKTYKSTIKKNKKDGKVSVKTIESPINYDTQVEPTIVQDENKEPIKLEMSGLYGIFGKNLNNKPMSNNKNSNTMKKQRKVKKTDAEVWIGRFKKDSTNQLMAKMNSPHYSVLQKRIIGEIIEKRRNKVLPTEKLLLRFKKSSTQTISKTLKSERFTDLDKAIMKQILKIRKTKK